jgi:predicted DNA-binding antitoxin AbrB/MazE fold protein
MTYDIDAIYKNGFFRPLEPLVIPEGVRVHLRLNEETIAGAAAKKMSRAEMDEFLRVMAELPV